MSYLNQLVCCKLKKKNSSPLLLLEACFCHGGEKSAKKGNCNFISQNCDVISQKSDFISHNCEFKSHKSAFFHPHNLDIHFTFSELQWMHRQSINQSV